MKKYLSIFAIVIATLLIGALIYSIIIKRADNTTYEAQTSFIGLSPQQFKQKISTGDYKILDIRTEDEYNAGHLKNTAQIDYYQTEMFSGYLDKLDKNAMYLIYCRSGNRSKKAMSLMKEKGFAQVWDLAGGYNAWTASGLPTE